MLTLDQPEPQPMSSTRALPSASRSARSGTAANQPSISVR